MKQIVILLSILFLLPDFGICQDGNERAKNRMEAQANKLSMSKYILNDDTYIPYPDSFVPAKTLKVRLVFIHFSEDDPRNFDANDPEHMAFFKKIFDRVNERYRNLVDVNNCGDFIQNSQLQFKIIDQVNIISAEKWDNSIWGDNAVNSASRGVIDLHEWLPTVGVERDAINCVFTEASCFYDENFNNGNGCGTEVSIPLNSGVSASSPFPNNKLLSGSTNHYRNKFSGWFGHNNNANCEKYPNRCCPACPESWQTDPTNYIHELGHSIWGPHINNKCNHIMTNYIQGTYSSAKELGKIHRSMSVMNTRELVFGCPKGKLPMVIDKTESWETDFKSYNDIVIKDGGHLIIKNKLAMPLGSTITIERGGKLTLDEALITKSCDENWSGIEIIPEPSFLFFKTTKNQLFINGNSTIEGSDFSVKKIKKSRN